MTAAPLPRHSLDHRSPLPTRAPEIAVPSLTGSRQTPHGHRAGDDAVDRPSRSPMAEAALPSPRRQGAADPSAEPDSADPRMQATRPPGPPPGYGRAPPPRPGHHGDLPGPQARSALPFPHTRSPFGGGTDSRAGRRRVAPIRRRR